MNSQPTFLEALQERGVSRRAFLKFCSLTASSLALSGQAARLFAEELAAAPRPTVIWLSFQQCTGCSESLLRSFNPSLENLILNVISLDYHETLQVAAGDQAEKARADAMQAAFGRYVLIVDGSIPWGKTEYWSTVAGSSNLAALKEAVDGAALVVALGTCATFGGIPAAYPNPSSASGYGELVEKGRIKPASGRSLPPYVNVSGCPPVPEVITGTIAWYLVNKTLPELDALRRPKVYYGKTVHDCCPRLPQYDLGLFAQSHGDDGAKQGYCLYLLGCKGAETYNACTTVKWNGGLSSPTHSGHGCLACSEPKFWDREKVVVKGSDGKDVVSFGSFYTPNAKILPVTGECTAPPPLLTG
jgi:hydrogenase small subunit